jgi:hypothetical protein
MGKKKEGQPWGTYKMSDVMIVDSGVAMVGGGL